MKSETPTVEHVRSGPLNLNKCTRAVAYVCTRVGEISDNDREIIVCECAAENALIFVIVCKL